MPLPIEAFNKLSRKKARQQSKRQEWTLNLSEKCEILPNWKTDKYGHCKRYGCQFRGEKGCVARD